jgi:diaminopimelate decarboxylase
MDYFNYKNGKLFAEDTDVERIAAEVGTPVYLQQSHLQESPAKN